MAVTVLVVWKSSDLVRRFENIFIPAAVGY
jgi:hypothetical protein